MIKRLLFNTGEILMIQYVYLLTEHQKDSLMGQLVQPDWYFYPVQDCNENWIISQEEIDNSIYPEHEWILDLPKIDWCAPIIPNPPIS